MRIRYTPESCDACERETKKALKYIEDGMVNVAAIHLLNAIASLNVEM